MLTYIRALTCSNDKCRSCQDKRTVLASYHEHDDYLYLRINLLYCGNIFTVPALDPEFAYLHGKGVKEVQFKRSLRDIRKVHVRSPRNYSLIHTGNDLCMVNQGDN